MFHISKRSVLTAALTVPLALGVGLGSTAGAASASTSAGSATTSAAVTQSASAAYAATWYNITTYTSDISGAGTDGHVWLRINGDRGSSTWLYLDNSSDNFERGRYDYFRHVLSNLGNLRSVDIYFNRAGWSPAWHAGYVYINGVYFPVNRWFDSSGTQVRAYAA